MEDRPWPGFHHLWPPSDIERYPNERGTVPHEIWKYDKLGTQAQVVFIFIDRKVHPSNQYELSHSTKYGELQNPTLALGPAGRAALNPSTFGGET
ncbi:MAG: hypothetical protein R3B47_09590 [Bacteroidia bacterium]